MITRGAPPRSVESPAADSPLGRGRCRERSAQRDARPGVVRQSPASRLSSAMSQLGTLRRTPRLMRKGNAQRDTLRQGLDVATSLTAVSSCSEEATQTGKSHRPDHARTVSSGQSRRHRSAFAS
jgi:hypothetical protein